MVNKAVSWAKLFIVMQLDYSRINKMSHTLTKVCARLFFVLLFDRALVNQVWSCFFTVTSGRLNTIMRSVTWMLTRLGSQRDMTDSIAWRKLNVTEAPGAIPHMQTSLINKTNRNWAVCNSRFCCRFSVWIVYTHHLTQTTPGHLSAMWPGKTKTVLLTSMLRFINNA